MRWRRTTGVILGELDGAMTPRLQALAAAIAAGGMGGIAVPDIRAAVWAKLLGNMMNGPLCLLARSSMQDTLSVPVVRDAAIAAAREVMAIAAAYGHPITGQTPEDRIARSSKIPHRPSILQDLDQGGRWRSTRCSPCRCSWRGRPGCRRRCSTCPSRW